MSDVEKKQTEGMQDMKMELAQLGQRSEKVALAKGHPWNTMEASISKRDSQIQDGFKSKKGLLCAAPASQETVHGINVGDMGQSHSREPN